MSKTEEMRDLMNKMDSSETEQLSENKRNPAATRNMTVDKKKAGLDDEDDVRNPAATRNMTVDKKKSGLSDSVDLTVIDETTVDPVAQWKRDLQEFYKHVYENQRIPDEEEFHKIRNDMMENRATISAVWFALIAGTDEETRIVDYYEESPEDFQATLHSEGLPTEIIDRLVNEINQRGYNAVFDDELVTEIKKYVPYSSLDDDVWMGIFYNEDYDDFMEYVNDT